MRVELKPHPETPSAAVNELAVEIERRAGGVLALHYVLTGATSELRLPPKSLALRTDELWRSTCFEAFVRGDGEGYFEFNFAPSTQWAAYRFQSYRAGMSVAHEIASPDVEIGVAPDRFELTASLAAPQISPWRVGLSAVIEATNGAKSYWALAHPPGRPDFHHADSFALELA